MEFGAGIPRVRQQGPAGGLLEQAPRNSHCLMMQHMSCKKDCKNCLKHGKHVKLHLPIVGIKVPSKRQAQDLIPGLNVNTALSGTGVTKSRLLLKIYLEASTVA